MCINPGLMPNGQLVGCRKCWQCQELRVNDWVGRNIAESKTAAACHFVTLTYGRDLTIGSIDHERAVVLTYSDVQKFFKRVRKAGHKFRYFVIGEYGSLKGRSHWHILMYWDKTFPKFTVNVRENSPFWDHGFVRWEDIRNQPGAIRYACKYIQKDIGNPEKQGHISMSKYPPLGTAYFKGLAKKFVDAQLSPQKLIYGWPDVVDKNGNKIPFMMRNVVAETFVKEFLKMWERTHGSQHAPYSQAVENIRDRLTRQSDMGEWESYKAGVPWGKTPGGVATVPRLHAMFKIWYCLHEGNRYWWQRSESTGEFEWTRETENASASAANVERLPKGEPN